MRRNLSAVIILFFIFSLSFSILLYGVNQVCNNMNVMYSSSQNIDSESSESKEVIPVFISLNQTEPYVYEIVVMDSGFKFDFNKLVDGALLLKDRIVYFVVKNI